MNKQLSRRQTNFVLHYKVKRNYLVKQMWRRTPTFVRHYLDELSFYLNEKTLSRLRAFGQFFGTVLLSAIVAFIFINYLSPITVHYSMGQDTKNVSQIGPKNRIKSVALNGIHVTKVSNDLVYFTTEMPFPFDSATVKLFYQNPNADQTIFVGFHDQQNWHYNIKPFDAPFLNSLNWAKSGYSPTLYQRKKNYLSLDSFLRNPPQDTIIGTFNDNTDLSSTFQTKLSDYQPAPMNTLITVPLRGKQTIYAYLDNEPFHMRITKQDLNWYVGPDPVAVSIYKDNDLVYQTTMNDDGVIDASRKIIPPQDLEIKNPGPDLPEAGVYKIVINANDDTIIKSIQMNLHKIVFQGPLFLAGNSQIYPGAVASTSASTLYTNALLLSALTYHNAGEQMLFVGNKPVNLNMVQIPSYVTPPDDLTQVTIPKNDVILNAFQGYFSFSPNQFFLPTNYHILPITTSEDIGMVDYIVADYSQSHKEEGWQVNEQTFDLSSAYTINNKLSWIIESPHLKQKNNSIIIKDIQITFHKNGLL